MFSRFVKNTIAVLTLFALFTDRGAAADAGLLNTFAGIPGSSVSSGFDSRDALNGLGGLDGSGAYGGQFSLENPVFSRTSPASRGLEQPEFLRDFGQSLLGQHENNAATLRGQHRKQRGQSGGGLVSFSTYLADTVIKDARYSDLLVKPDLWGLRISYDLNIGRANKYWLGLYYNYNNTYTKWGDVEEWGRRFVVNNHLVGLSYTSFTGLSHLQLNLSVGYDDYDQNGFYAKDEEGNLVELPSFTSEGMQVNFFGEFGLDLIPNATWEFKPFYAMEYNYLYVDDFSCAGYKLDNGEANCHALKSILGMRVNWRCSHWFCFQARAAWVQQLLEDNAPICNMNYSMVQGYATPTQYLFDAEQGRAFAWLGLTAKFCPTKVVRFFIDYDLLINECNTSHIGHFGMILRW